MKLKKHMNDEKFSQVMTVISFIGLGITIFMIYQHYFGNSICDISKFISCETVNRSTYSTVLGIPVAGLGTAYFVLMIVLFGMYPKNKKFLNYILYISILALVPAFYLTYVELFILNAICLFCESTKAVIILIVILALNQMRKRNKLL